VPVAQVLVQDAYVTMPKPRHALDNDITVPMLELGDDGPRLEVEALAMLSSLASDFDY
jgi:hypothetical protein